MKTDLKPLDRAEEIFERHPGARTLVVLVHAYTMRPASLDRVAAAVRDQLPTADVLRPHLPVQNPFTTVDPNGLARALVQRITLACAEASGAGGYAGIVLVGHSLGALILRRAFVLAWNDRSNAWVGRVSRIILLAAMNRGWTMSHHLRPTTALVWRIAQVLGRGWELLRRRPPIIFTIRKGGRFISELQLAWLEMLERAGTGERGGTRGPDARPLPLTIQLLGSVDDMVSPEDNVDLVTGSDFIYLDVPHSGHANVIEMDDSPAGRQRRGTFQSALVEDAKALGARAVHPADDIRPPRREDVTDVVFVIHGIRDVGYWTHKIARRVQAQGVREGRLFATWTSTYGYFPMLPFILPGRRREKVRWLVDQYVEAKALYPRARFAYVGHSNGTYMLARALEDYPGVRFQNVVFAGSVVRRRYPWQAAMRRGQVGAVLNYVATTDWVVACFPKLFEFLRVQDLGSAGHDGFDEAARGAPHLEQITYIRGQHSAALVEENWDAIVQFVLHGSLRDRPQPPAAGAAQARRRNWLVTALGCAPYLVWACVVCLLALTFKWLLASGDVSLLRLGRLAWEQGEDVWARDPAMYARLAATLLLAGGIKRVLTRL